MNAKSISSLFGLVWLALSTTAGAVDLNIGYQKSAVNLLSLKSRGVLEQKLKPLGVTVKWFEFQSGPPLLEALNAGNVNLGMTGDAPPVFAQAAGVNLLYAGSEPAKPESSAILVSANSPIHRLSDLKGKRVAFTKGSSAHYLVVQALKKAGLKYSDIQPVTLTPAEARAAFERSSVDAWAIWDPYYAAAQRAGQVRVLSTGKGLTSNNTFYLANRDFARQNPKVLTAVFRELSQNDRRFQQHIKQNAQELANLTGVEAATYETVLSRHPHYSVDLLKPATVQDQQQVADAFYQLGLIPKPVRVKDIVWQP